jgi:multiple sugar transport system ATP-binding protein
MAKVTLKNVFKIFPNNVVAVNDFDLEIADKEFIVLVGPSGCGKSTTLRMIAGLEEVSKGEIYIGDKLVNDVPPKDRDIAMVFQNYALYPHMTVYENMAFGLKLRKTPKKVIEQKVQAAAKILNIEEYLDRKPKALSGGQRQRVALGRAIVRQPQVFLMDEPLSNLDAKLRTQMRTEILKLHQILNTTFIYVTHDQTEAMTMGDRIVVMKDGFVQQIASPKEIFEKPVNLFVAGFIGSPQMNFIPAKLTKDKEKYAVTFNKNTIELPQETASLLKTKNIGNSDIILGVRPENIAPAKDEANAITAQVEVTEMMGWETYVHMKLDEHDLTGRINADYPVKAGQVLQINFDPNKLHLFDAKTEANLLI